MASFTLAVEGPTKKKKSCSTCKRKKKILYCSMCEANWEGHSKKVIIWRVES